MRKNDKMQRVVMSVLVAMFVASLIVAVVSFARPVPARADVQPQDFCYTAEITWCDTGYKWCRRCVVCCPIYPPCKWSCDYAYRCGTC